MKKSLPSISLICVDCLNANRAINAIEECKKSFDFGSVKLLTSIPSHYEHAVRIKPLNSLIAYSVFMVTKFHEFIDTDYVLVVQRDGFIINPKSWDDSWVEKFDYIAPLFIQYPRVGSGGFSLRSKKLMQAVSESMPDWDWTQKQADEIQGWMGMYEDGFISLSERYSNRFKIAPPEEAMKFAQGGSPDMEFYYPYPFGFHGTINNIDHATGFVSPVCEHGGNCECTQPHVDYLFNMEK